MCLMSYLERSSMAAGGQESVLEDLTTQVRDVI